MCVVVRSTWSCAVVQALLPFAMLLVLVGDAQPWSHEDDPGAVWHLCRSQFVLGHMMSCTCPAVRSISPVPIHQRGACDIHIPALPPSRYT